MITMRMIPMMITMTTTKKIILPLLRIPLAIGLLSCMFSAVPVAFAFAQEHPAAQQSDQASTEKPATAKPDAEKPSQPEGEANQAEHQPKGIGGVLAKETREAEGEEEEHADLKHSSIIFLV